MSTIFAVSGPFLPDGLNKHFLAEAARIGKMPGKFDTLDEEFSVHTGVPLDSAAVLAPCGCCLVLVSSAHKTEPQVRKLSPPWHFFLAEVRCKKLEKYFCEEAGRGDERSYPGLARQFLTAGTIKEKGGTLVFAPESHYGAEFFPYGRDIIPLSSLFSA